MLVTNGIIHTMEQDKPFLGWVLIENGKFRDVGIGAPPASDEVLDAGGGHVLPGLVDAHCHLGLVEDSLGIEGEDLNEDTGPCNPHLRAIDAINPMDRGFGDALRAGITTVVTGPGSANPIGGQFAAIKTYGRRIDDMIVKAPSSMKFALGENPKNFYSEKNEAPATRMATAAIIRENLYKATEYMRRKDFARSDEDEEEPDFDIKLESLIPLLRREIPAHFHAHRADDIFTAARIAKEFNLRFSIIHGTDGHLVADILASENIGVITGPTMSGRSKPELSNQQFETAGILSKAGSLCAICTDHPETPIQYLTLCAALAVKAGMDGEEALRAITINAAKLGEIDSSVGSILPGKDGDLVVFSGEPLSLTSAVNAVIIGGKRVV